MNVITRMLPLCLLLLISNTEENLCRTYCESQRYSVYLLFKFCFICCVQLYIFATGSCNLCYYEVVGRRTLMKRKKRDWEGFRHRWLQSLEQRAQSACPCPMTGGGNRDEQRLCFNHGNQNGSAKKHSIQKEKAVDIFESIIRFAQCS